MCPVYIGNLADFFSLWQSSRSLTCCDVRCPRCTPVHDDEGHSHLVGRELRQLNTLSQVIYHVLLEKIFCNQIIGMLQILVHISTKHFGDYQIMENHATNRVNSLDLCNNVKGCLDGSVVEYSVTLACINETVWSFSSVCYPQLSFVDRH